MTALVQQQKHNKPAILAGFILLPAIAIFFALTTLWGASSFTVATLKPIPQIQYQTHAVHDQNLVCDIPPESI